MIEFESLTPRQGEIAKKLIDESGTEIDGWFRFWSTFEVQLDGDFGVAELELFIKIFRAFREEVK